MTDARQQCAWKLEELASDPRFSGRHGDLTSLAGALRNQDDGSWTGVDLIASFPPESSVTIRHRQILERLLGVLAGVSVFLPVGWTWLSLHSATNAYNDLLTAGDEEGRTFLALWTTGFDGRLDGWHQLVPMAMVSFCLILCAVAFIVAHRLVAEFNVSREERAGSNAQQTLVVTLVTAQRLLNERRTDDPRFLEEAIKRSIGQLNKAHSATRKGVAELEQATVHAVSELKAAAGGLAGELRPLLEAASAAGNSLSESAAAAVKAQQQMSASTTEIHTGLGRALVEFSSAIEEHNNQLTDRTGAAFASLTGGVDQAVSRMTGGMDSVMKELTGGLGGAMAELSTGVGAATAANSEWSRALQEGLVANTQSTVGIDGRVDQFVKILQEHQGTLQAQANELRRAADLAGQLLDELRSRVEPDAVGR